MNSQQILVGSLAVLLTCGLARSQQHEAPPPLDAVRVPIHSSPDDLGIAYGTWAAGDGYKASFHDGMTFVPYLGSDYPHNQPLSWRTIEARVGDASLLGEGEAAPRGVRASDWRYEYHHAGIIEAYDVRVEGLEQTFVVDRLPQRGDLVVRGALTSAMHAANGDAAHGALTLCDEQGRELVRYGAAFAIDAAGRRLAIPTQHVDGQVTLRVPDGWLANAQLPVTIDPLLSRSTVSTWSGSNFGEVEQLDISSALQVVFVFSRAASATDSDCYGIRTYGDYSGETSIWADVSSSWSSDAPCCAWSQVADNWVFAWRRYFDGVSPTRSGIRVHLHPWLTATFNAAYQAVGMPAGHNDWRPDLGGCPYGNATTTGGTISSTHFMLVYQRENNGVSNFANTTASDVVMTWLDVQPGATSATVDYEGVLRGDLVHDYERPNVGQQSGNERWAVVWQVYDNLQFFGDWDVEGAAFGVPAAAQTQPIELTTITPPNQAPGHHQTGPQVSGVSIHAIVYAESAAGTSGKVPDIAGESMQAEAFRINWYGLPGPGASIWWEGHSTIRSSSARYWEPTDVSVDTRYSSHFVLGFRTVNTTLPAAYFVRLGGFAGVVEGESDGDALLYVAFNETPSPVATTFDVYNDEWRLGYAVDGAFGQPLFGQTVQQPTALPVVSSGVGCTPATLSFTGGQLVGSRTAKVSVNTNGAPPSFHLLLVSTGVLDLPVVHPVVASGCRLLVDTTAPAYVGMLTEGPSYPVVFPFALPEFLPPLFLFFQDWLFDGNELRSTQRLTVPIAR